PLDERLRVELEQPRVVAHHAARDRRTGQAVEALLLERLDLARRELELKRHVVDGETLRLARLLQRGADAGQLSQSCPAAAPGTRGNRESAAAAGWRSSARRLSGPTCARCAARATATRRPPGRACCSARRGAVPRPSCPACSGSGRD